jgi:hypothetical protein
MSDIQYGKYRYVNGCHPTKLCVRPESMIIDTLGGICTLNLIYKFDTALLIFKNYTTCSFLKKNLKNQSKTRLQINYRITKSNYEG